MSMAINALMSNEAAEVYYDPEFRAVVDVHVEYLKNHPQADILVVDPNVAYKHEHDFYGLLRSYNVSPTIQWTILRINGYTSPTEYTSENLDIVIIPDSLVVELSDQYRTING